MKGEDECVNLSASNVKLGLVEQGLVHRIVKEHYILSSLVRLSFLFLGPLKCVVNDRNIFYNIII